MKQSQLVSLICFFAISLPLIIGATPPDEESQVHIKRSAVSIKVDGALDESIWQESEMATDFWMSFPVDDRKAERRTEVRLTYDDNFLYVGIKCYSNEDYVIQTLKRDLDFWSGDGFAIVLDPVNQRTNGFVFGINPAGVQMETLITGYTGNRGGPPRGMNQNWDHKWYGEVQSLEDGWTAEMAIPFKTLRYEEDRTTWGVNFIRSDMVDNSYHTWSKVPLQFRSIDLGYTGSLIWDQAPQKQNGNIAFVPYVNTSSTQDFEEKTPVEYKTNVGFDAKVAITSSLNLDLTVNPDFSQVEIDEQITNVTRFNIRLPERRTFFLENADVFEDFGRGQARPFFSRRIGLDEDGNTIPILYGMRLSGNIDNKLRVGLMNIQTKANEIQQEQNYTAFAVHRQLFRRSTVKGYFLNQQSMNGSEVNFSQYSRNVGTEFTYFSQDGKIRAWGGYGQSFKPYLKGKDQFYKWGIRYTTKKFGALYSASTQGDNYYQDMGFLQRVNNYDAARDTTIRLGYTSQTTSLSYRIFPKKETTKWLYGTWRFQNSLFLNNDLSFNETNTEVSYTLTYNGRSELAFEYSNTVLDLLFPFSFTDATPLPPKFYNFNSLNVSFRSDGRKKLSYEIGTSYGSFYNGTRSNVNLSLKYRQQPWGNFGVNLDFNDLQFPDPYGSEQILLLGPRIEIGFSRNLFWTTFLQWNTQGDNFNINSRLQWRFKPMSDVFLVYTDNYGLELFAPKSRALVLKVNYWLTL